MKKCVSCAKDLQDEARHCVFCGVKQPAAAAPAAPEQGSAKTVMGFSAAELIKNVQAQQRPAAPPPAAPMPAPQPFAPMPAPQPYAPAPAPMPVAATMPAPMSAPQPPSMAKTAFISPGAAGPAPYAPPAAAPPPAAPRPAAPMPMPAPAPYVPPPAAAPMPMPAPAPSPQSQAKTMFMDGGGALAAPAPAPAPAPMFPASNPIAATLPAPMHSPVAPAPMPEPAPRPRSDTAKVAPHSGPTPPYLASQTAARMGRPIDPFAGGLQLVLIVFGLLLVAGFCTPLATKPSMAFHWDGISDQPGKQLVVPILWMATGVLGAVFGAIPLASIPRAAVGAALGLLAIVYPAVALQGHDFAWEVPVIAAGGVLAPAGLLIRDAYRGEGLGRILTTIGALCIIAAYLVPERSAIPLTDVFLKQLTDGEGVAAKIQGAFLIAPFALAVISLVAWLPGSSSAGAKPLAWLWILLPILGHFSFVIASGHIGDQVKANPFDFFFSDDGVIAAAYVAFASYGLATLLGKNLERR